MRRKSRKRALVRNANIVHFFAPSFGLQDVWRDAGVVDKAGLVTPRTGGPFAAAHGAFAPALEDRILHRRRLVNAGPHGVAGLIFASHEGLPTVDCQVERSIVEHWVTDHQKWFLETPADRLPVGGSRA